MTFALTSAGPEAPCGYPNCMLEAFHEGEHEFPAPDPPRSQGRKYHCIVCGTPMVFYGDYAHPLPQLCESQHCLLHFARRTAPEFLPISCRCPQRIYAHDLTVHATLRQEAYNPRLKFRYPWSLMLSDRSEPSTEKREAA